MRGLSMYYSELSGPSGTTNALTTTTNTTRKAADSKNADPKATEAKTGDAKAATPAKTGSPAFTISQSMESLLDSMTGQGAKSAAAGAAGGGTGATGGSLERAQQAQGLLQNALDHGKGLSGLFGKAIDTMKQGLGDVLGALGMSEDEVNSATSGFGNALNDKLANMDFSKMAVDMTAARSQWSIESHGMELTIQDGDRKVQISFAKSTLDFRKDEQRLQGVLDRSGSGSVGMESTTTTATGKSTGIIVRGEGFSEDEIKSILGKLNGMAAKAGGDGMKGLAVLKPTTSKNGVTHMTLDLSVPVEGLTDGKSDGGTAAASATSSGTAKTAGVNVTA
ncbi:hypothetical protein [Azospirillum griseum]|nr:hypothetical protein [Azospirillum griseum]